MFRIKFSMDVMPFGATLKSYVSIFYNRNTNMADEGTFEVGSTLAPLATGPYNDVNLHII